MAKVNTKHPEYLANEATWARCRDFTKGSQAVKDAGEAYLAKLNGQSPEAYGSYKDRAQFYNATARTVDGMGGLVMRVEPTMELPAALTPLVDDIDYQGTSIFEFTKRLVTEDLTVGRGGILVDFPERQEGVATVAQATATGLRPYLAFYPTETIVNWKTERVNGATVLNMVVLMETLELPDPDDEFTMVPLVQYRVLDLDGLGYRQRIYRVKEGDKTGTEWEQFGPDILPLAGAQRMPSIPFVFIGSETNTPNVQKSPIADLVEVNLGHYRNSADHEHGLHFTALPTPVITGHTVMEGESIAIGSETFLCLKSPQASAFYMEFNGAGLTPIQEAMTEKKKEMATLGARMLADDSKGVEAAETARIHRSGEAGVLGSLAGSVGKGMTRALTMAADWAKAAGGVTYTLNKDFLPTTMAPGMLKELLATWQSGGISMPVLFDNLQRGEIIGPDVDLETMQKDIDDNIPGFTDDTDPGATGAE